MIYEAKCPICGKVSKLEVDDTAYMAYKAGIGKIQRLFPDLKPEERVYTGCIQSSRKGTRGGKER